MGHYFRLLLDCCNVGDCKTVEKIDQHKHDEEDVDEEDDPAELGGEVDALKLNFSGEADDDGLHERHLRTDKVSVHFLPIIVLLSATLKYDEEAESEGDDEHNEPDEKLGEVVADLSEHCYVSREEGMASHEKQAFSPGEEDDNAREVSMHHGIGLRGAKQKSKAQSYQDNFHQVLDIEDVPSNIID